MTTDWGYTMQGNAEWEEIDQLGIYLNLTIDCAIHYPAFGKRLFECKHGVIFPVYVVKQYFKFDGQLELKSKHQNEKGMIEN